MHIGLVDARPAAQPARQPRHGESLGWHSAGPRPPGHAEPDLRRAGFRLAGSDPRTAERTGRRGIKARQPAKPVVVLLAGTDVYGPLYEEGGGLVLDLADRLVTLQHLAADELRQEHRHKVTYHCADGQANARLRPIAKRSPLRRERRGSPEAGQGSLLAAKATRRLPQSSRIRVLQLGDPMSPAMARQAGALAARHPRYAWMRGLPTWRARRLLKRSRVMVISSLSEGGANVVSEAAVDGVPILASRMPRQRRTAGRRLPRLLSR